MMTGTETFNSIEQFRSSSGGVLLVDKPLEWTSFDVVKKVRGTLRIKKVGHAGTLDPLATGLLILASNRMTKSLGAFQALLKTYEGEFFLGGTTESFDAASPVVSSVPVDHLSAEQIYYTCQKFIGNIQQIPPMYSAVKVNGERLYSLARRGDSVEREPRFVEIHSFEIKNICLPVVSFKVVCSKGTYVRSLVHDIGQDLCCGAYLQNLRRTAIGEFFIQEAWTIGRIVETARSSSSIIPA